MASLRKGHGMNRARIWLAVSATAAMLVAAPMSAMAQEAVPVTTDEYGIVGWQDDQTGPIYGNLSDVQAQQAARAEAQLQADMSSNPELYAGADMDDCAQ